MKTLTKQELVDLLSKVKGTTFVSLETKTVPKLRAGNPFVSLEKVSKIAGAIGFNYQNSVNYQRKREDKEPDFESEERKWGQRIPKTPLVEHKGKFYLEVKVQNSHSDYIENGQRISFDKIQQWMYNSKSRQEVSQEIILRDYSLDSIQRIKINKEEYTII